MESSNKAGTVLPEHRKDDELMWLLIINGLFTVTLVLMDFFMLKGNLVWWYFGILACIHVGVGYYWCRSLQKFHDPNFDWTRKVCFVFLIAGCLTVGAQYSTWLGKYMFEKDVEKAKQEQAR